MPRVSEIQLRRSSRRIESQPIATLLVAPPMAAEFVSEPEHEQEFSTEDELQSIDIKQEPRDEMEVEVEVLHPNETEANVDPIGQDNIRCQFCLKQFREVSGRAVITQLKIEFVLGLSKWIVPGTLPVCCEDCRKMFELFYEFKQSCLEALARPVEIFVWAGANKRAAQFVDKKLKMEQEAELVGLEEIPKEETASVQSLPLPLNQDIENDRFESEICSEKNSDGWMLKEHCLNQLPLASNTTAVQPKDPDERTDQEQEKSYCGRCRKWFATHTIFAHHKPFCIKFQGHKKPKPFVCTLCPSKFNREQDLTLHINKHNGIRTVPCRKEGCTKLFFTPQVRYTHEQFCGRDGQFICSICGTRFRSSSALRTHSRTHEDPQFSCELCSKAFFSKVNLKKHAATHSDERKFQCKVCGKRFKSHEANRVHQRIHTQEKPYACHICGQRFMYNCLLKTHLEKGHEPENAA